MPEPVQGTKSIGAEKERRFESPGVDLDFDRSIDRSGFRPNVKYTPEYAGHGIDLEALRIQDERAYGRNLYGGFQIPELNIE
jgi:hypothetical protein